MRPLALLTILALSASSALAADPPVLDSIDVTELTRSGRFQVIGSDLDQAGQIHISGIPAHVWPIPGTNAVAMNGYVPEHMPYGPAEITVTTSAGTSNALPVTIVPRVPQGRQLWRFKLNNQLMLWRPAVGSDGTIYARSQAGDLTAVSPQGERKWLLQLGAGTTPQVDIGPDDTIYTAADSTIYAVNPDGTLKWTYTDPVSSQGVIAGPNVGPDGNIYVVTHVPGAGVFSLDPQGQLRWTGPDTDLYSPWGQIGQEIVFGEDRLFFCVDDIFECFDFDGQRLFQDVTVTQSFGNCPQPAAGKNGAGYVEEWGQLRGYDSDGNLEWKAFGVGGSYLRHPDVGADGSIYVVRNVQSLLWALDPDGSTRWTYDHPYTLLHASMAPSDQTLVIGGAGVGLDQPRFFLALDRNGRELWNVDLPAEQWDPWTLSFPTPQGRATWAHDSSVAYTMASGPAWSGGHCSLYALQVAPIVELGHALPGTAGEPQLAGTGTLETGNPVTLALSDALASAQVWWIAGTEALGAPFKGGVMLPAPELIIGRTSSAAGTAQLDFAWPAGVPANTPLYVQAWIDDPAAPAGFAASNALSMITP